MSDQASSRIAARRTDRQLPRVGEHVLPFGQAFFFIPVEIVDQAVLRLPAGHERRLSGRRHARRLPDTLVERASTASIVREFFGQRIRLVRLARLIGLHLGPKAPSPSRLFCPDAGAAPPRPVSAKRPSRLSAQSGVCGKNLAAGAQHRMRAGELVGRRADVHVGVVQDQVLEVDELALEPERGGRVGKVLALDKTVAHRRAGQPLVEARQNLGRARDRPDQGLQGQICRVS